MQNIEQTLKTLIENDEAQTFVVVVSNDAARLKRQSELIAYHTNNAVANLQVIDIENFVQRLANQVQPTKLYISAGIQRLWLHEIASPDSHHAEKNQYNAFRPTSNTPIPDSTLALIADTIDTLREHGETSQNNIIPDNPTTADLQHIYSTYEEKLGNRWIDDKGKHLYLANNFKPRYMKQAFPQAKLIVVEGFSVLSKADIQLLKHIAGMPEIEMWFRTDCLPDNQHLYKNITALVAEFKSVNVHIDTDFERNPEKHLHFAQNLFTTKAMPKDGVVDLTDQIKVLEPADRTEEVEQIAHLIQKHAIDGNCKLGDISVVHYNIGPYQQRIADIFPVYGIPYAFIENIPLTKSEVVKAIFSRISADRAPINDTYFADVVDPLPQTQTLQPTEFQEYVDNLLHEGEVLQRILNPMLKENWHIVQGEVHALQQFRQIVQELCAILMVERSTAYPIADYITKLKYIAKHTRYQNKSLSKGEKVQIVPLGDLRSLTYDIVFLGDFVDGGFPQTYRPDPILPNTLYRTQDEHLHDNRFLFYRVLKSFRKRLYLLSPKRERETELIPSIFRTQLEAIANIEIEEIAQFEQTSITGFLSAYGNHVQSVDTPSAGEFPDNYENMRALINHVVSVEKSREKTHQLTAYEGQLNGTDILTGKSMSDSNRVKLEKYREKKYSVTELEIYAKCPFQYFVHHVLKYKVEEDEEAPEPSRLEKGTLVHDVLFAFYNYLRDNGYASVAQCSEEDFENAKQQLNQLLHTKSEERRIERSDISVDNLFWKTEIEKQRVALHKWLDAERTNKIPITQSFFEVSFDRNTGQRDPSLMSDEAIEIGEVQLNGKIDRIDISDGVFSVIDYKTGSTIVRMQDILEGRSLQIPIYLQIAQKMLDQHSGFDGLKPAAGLYYKIRLNEFKTELGIGQKELNKVAYESYNGTDWKGYSSSGQLLEEALFYGRLARVSGYIQQYVDSIANGYFPLITRVDTYVDYEEVGDTPLTPKNRTAPCSYCAYKRLCRVGAFVESFQPDE